MGIGGLTASGFIKFFFQGGATALLSEIFFVTICAYVVSQSNKSEDIATVEALETSDEKPLLEQADPMNSNFEADVETLGPTVEAVVLDDAENET